MKSQISRYNELNGESEDFCMLCSLKDIDLKEKKMKDFGMREGEKIDGADL